ncbi:MAG: Unknown protein [uncultured Sulfurovum sp.]|uniref:Arsenical-resistance protein ACR3 n=1 Tax=uncultured Sulfurovum sp. TaxID=269237 RepID=A0A6S6UJD4_9BACT|nr:MAG: Unknown protein [uncultured Sulfurovum sp.]
MQLIFIVILGAILGFWYGSDSNGFVFTSNICLFAGLTLIMPSLFKFEFSHVSLVWKYKLVFFKGFVVNYMLLPLFAIAIGLMTGDFGITAGLFLLAVFSGGGMVMHWIKRSGGDTSFGFLLLFINLLFVSLSLLMLHIFATYSAGYFDVDYRREISISNFVSVVIELLIIIPLIASRVVIYIKPLVNFIDKYRKYISHISIFIILFYLFGLQSTQRLVDVYDFEPELFPIALISVIFFYILTLVASMFIYNLESPQERAAFWHSVTRYLTLALLISTFSLNTFGVSILLPVMFAYLVQIPLSVFVDKKYMQTATDTL